MNKQVKKIIFIGVILAGMLGGYYYYSTREITGIYQYRPARDRQFILDIFEKNWYWLVEGDRKSFSVKYLLDNRKRNPDSQTKEDIKVLVIEGEPVGFVTYYKEKFYQGVIHFLAVKPEVRSKGYGKKLLTYAVNDLMHQGVKYIHLITRTTNYAGQKVYNALGFKETGRDEGFVDFEKVIK